MLEWSANLGLLWPDKSIPDGIHLAKEYGFQAVECHWPYDTKPNAILSAFDATGLPMLGINSGKGDVSKGEFGLAALPGREKDARASIDQALSYASAIGCDYVHVLAGLSHGDGATSTFTSNLEYAADQANGLGITVLIEALNKHDAPGYFLNTTDQACAVIASVAAPNLKLMFDCYHVGRTEGDVVEKLKQHYPIIGHIQFASVPERRQPDIGSVDYRAVFAAIKALGWGKPLGAEFAIDNGKKFPTKWMTELC